MRDREGPGRGGTGKSANSNTSGGGGPILIFKKTKRTETLNGVGNRSLWKVHSMYLTAVATVGLDPITLTSTFASPEQQEHVSSLEERLHSARSSLQEVQLHCTQQKQTISELQVKNGRQNVEADGLRRRVEELQQVGKPTSCCLLHILHMLVFLSAIL